MSAEFAIEGYRRKSELLVALRGRLVQHHASESRSRFNNLLTPNVDKIYVRLSELEFLDSAGLGALVSLKMSAGRNRVNVIFLSPPSRIEEVLRVSKLDSIFDIRRGAEADALVAEFTRDGTPLWPDQNEPDASSRPSSKRPATETSESQRTSPAGTASLMADTNDAQLERSRQLLADAVEYVRQGDYSRAVQTYERVLAAEPENLSALNNLGIIYEKREA